VSSHVTAWRLNTYGFSSLEFPFCDGLVGNLRRRRPCLSRNRSDRWNSDWLHWLM